MSWDDEDLTGSLRDREPKLEREPATLGCGSTASWGALCRAKNVLGSFPLVLYRCPRALRTPQWCRVCCSCVDSSVREVAVRNRASPPEATEGSPAQCPGSARATSRVRPPRPGSLAQSPGSLAQCAGSNCPCPMFTHAMSQDHWSHILHPLTQRPGFTGPAFWARHATSRVRTRAIPCWTARVIGETGSFSEPT